MKTVQDILKENGIEGEVADAIAKEVGENYRTIAETQQKGERIQALTDENAKLSEELAKVKELDGSNAEELAKLKEHIAELEGESEKRKAEDEEKAKAASFADSFKAALGDREFSGPIVRDAVMAKARKLSDDNPDLTVEEAIARAVGDGQGVWRNPQRDPNKMPIDVKGGTAEVTSLEQVKDMSTEDINKNWSAISKLLAQQK